MNTISGGIYADAALLHPYRQSAISKVLLELGNADRMEMEYGCREKHIGTGLCGLGKMLHCASSAGSDHRCASYRAYLADER